MHVNLILKVTVENNIIHKTLLREDIGLQLEMRETCIRGASNREKPFDTNEEFERIFLFIKKVECSKMIGLQKVRVV